MSKSQIEWTDFTWNPVTGCDRTSPGCLNCYAKQLHDMRYKAHLAGKNVAPCYHEPFESVQCHPDRLDALPLNGAPRKVFVNSMSDLFHKDVPDEFIDEVFAAMAFRPHMTFQILTKRAQRLPQYFEGLNRRRQGFFHEHHGYFSELLEERYGSDAAQAAWSRLKAFHHGPKPATSIGDATAWPWPLPNVWLGVSVENQKYADERGYWLRKTPAAVRFFSCEPLLGALDLSASLACSNCGAVVAARDEMGACGRCGSGLPGIHWVIVGGESGAGARPMHPDWARSIRDQCTAAGVQFFFKQWGEWRLRELGDSDDQPRLRIGEHGKNTQDLANCGPDMGNEVWMQRVGTKRAGRLLDGREWNEFPAQERVSA